MKKNNIDILFIIILICALINNYFKTKRLENKKIALNHPEKEIIFIGGSPRSGTTLLRVMMDSRPDIRCGDETKLITLHLLVLKDRLMNTLRNDILNKSGITDEVKNAANKAFIYEILERHGNYAPILCAKDPTITQSTIYLSQILPTSKFILMIRDARAIMPSIVLRGVSLGGFGKDLRQNFIIWNNMIEDMYTQCVVVTEKRCLPVFYEQLVLHPELELRNIFKFLNIEWNDAVLHHEDYFHKKIQLSDQAKSADQVIKPVNLDGLYDWVGKIPIEILDELDTIAPMLKKLGYDTKSEKPDYGKPDQKVLDNTFNIKANPEKWNELKKNFSIYARYDLI